MDTCNHCGAGRESTFRIYEKNVTNSMKVKSSEQVARHDRFFCAALTGILANKAFMIAQIAEKEGDEAFLEKYVKLALVFADEAIRQMGGK